MGKKKDYTFSYFNLILMKSITQNAPKHFYRLLNILKIVLANTTKYLKIWKYSQLISFSDKSEKLEDNELAHIF